MPSPRRPEIIYRYLLECHDRDNDPTMREIAEACKIPLSTVFRHLDWLEAQGYIHRGHTARSVRLLKPFLSDEDQVYACLVEAIKMNNLSPSLTSLHQLTGLSLARIRTVLATLEQDGRIQRDPEAPHLFSPCYAD